MGDKIVLDGDIVQFDSTFLPAVTIIPLGVAKMQGSGPATVAGTKVCVAGDESKVQLNCQYTAPPYTIPGQGTLKISGLGGDQQAKKTQSDGKNVILLGSKFKAELDVSAGAKMPPPLNTPDSNTKYSGFGAFQTTNTKFTGT